MRLWDFLFIVFVLIPVVTGGVWLRKEGLHLEYTQPGAAAAILGLWLYFLHRRGKSLAQSKVLSFFRKSWEFWCQSLEKSPVRTLLGAWALNTILWFGAAHFRHIHFRSGAADLGIFTNAIWNLAQTGTPLCSLKGGLTLLADHQNFLIYAIAPFFHLFPSPEILLLLQSAALSSTAIALFFLAKQYAKNELVALLPVLFLAYAPIRSANLFDFHPEILMLPLFLFGVLGIQGHNKKQKITGTLLFLLAALGKESGGPVAVGLGLAWIIGAAPPQSRSFARWFGAFAVLFGLALFYFDTRLLPPILNAPYFYGAEYAVFGNSPIDLIFAPFLHPLEFFGRVLAISRWKFLLGMLLPVGFLPLFGWRAFLAALPGFMMLFLTAGNQRLSLGFHYAIEPAIGTLFAAAAALAHPFVQKNARKFLLVLPWLALLTYGRSEVFHMRFYESTPHQQWLRTALLPALAPNIAVTASSAVVPHISTRRWVHLLPVIQENGQRADCVLWERSVNNTPMTEADEKSLESKLASNNYALEMNCRTLSLYRLGETSCLRQPVVCE